MYNQMLLVDPGISISRMSIANGCPIGMFMSGDKTGNGSLDFWHMCMYFYMF